MARNVELKARDRNPELTERRLLELGAVESATLVQRDTYFAVPHGLLKLREEPGSPSLLIPYDRADGTEPRVSEYDLCEVLDPERVRAHIAETHGVRIVVTKRRRLFLWEETVRVHLDDVDGLGRFVEIEAVAAPESDLRREHEQVRQLSTALGIEDGDLVDAGYADLLGRPAG